MRDQLKALAIVILFLAIGVVSGVFPMQDRVPQKLETLALNSGYTPVTLGNKTFRGQVADTDESRMKGLSGRPSLAADEALLFVFPQASAWGIWMKDMLFSIDIVWADAEKRIVTVKENVSPETFPEAFYPSEPALYVVELPAGSVAKHGIRVGGKIIF